MGKYSDLTTKSIMDRRQAAAAIFGAVTTIAASGLVGCSMGTVSSATTGSSNEGLGAAVDSRTEPSPSLPPATPNPESPFGVDEHVNITSIDDYLHLPGVTYRDMRLIYDPADYAAIGGSSVLDMALEGFKIVPFPYIGTLAPLPVSGAYDGPTLFDITWGEGIEILDLQPNYRQSELIISDLFPRDEPILLVCGGGGYAGMMREFLLKMGYDGSRVYNCGGMWEYDGYRAIELMNTVDPKAPEVYLWRADEAPIPFDQLDPLD